MSLDDGYAIRMAVEFLTHVITRLETTKALTDALEKYSYGSMLRVLNLINLLRSSPLAKYL